MSINGLNVTPWRLEMDGPRAVALLPVWVRDLASQWYWRFDPVRGQVLSETGVRLRDLVQNAPSGSEVTVSYEMSHPRSRRLGVWDWRTVVLVKRSGPGFCLSRYRYVYREPSGVWGLWLPVGGCLRYFGAFGDENEAAIAANRLGPKWCPAQFRVERVDRRGVAPTRPGSRRAAVPTGSGGREPRAWIEWADGRVETINPSDLA